MSKASAMRALIAVAGLTGAAHADTTARIERVWAKCSACHDVGTRTRSAVSGPAKVGPDLDGLMGRPAGRAKGFRYSRTFRQASFVWTRERLDAFLSSPQSVMPGTTMAFAGLRDPEDRALLVCWLSTPCAPANE